MLGPKILLRRCVITAPEFVTVDCWEQHPHASITLLSRAGKQWNLILEALDVYQSPAAYVNACVAIAGVTLTSPIVVSDGSGCSRFCFRTPEGEVCEAKVIISGCIAFTLVRPRDDDLTDMECIGVQMVCPEWTDEPQLVLHHERSAVSLRLPCSSVSGFQVDGATGAITVQTTDEIGSHPIRVVPVTHRQADQLRCGTLVDQWRVALAELQKLSPDGVIFESSIHDARGRVAMRSDVDVAYHLPCPSWCAESLLIVGRKVADELIHHILRSLEVHLGAVPLRSVRVSPLVAPFRISEEEMQLSLVPFSTSAQVFASWKHVRVSMHLAQCGRSPREIVRHETWKLTGAVKDPLSDPHLCQFMWLGAKYCIEARAAKSHQHVAFIIASTEDADLDLRTVTQGLWYV